MASWLMDGFLQNSAALSFQYPLSARILVFWNQINQEGKSQSFIQFVLFEGMTFCCAWDPAGSTWLWESLKIKQVGAPKQRLFQGKVVSSQHQQPNLLSFVFLLKLKTLLPFLIYQKIRSGGVFGFGWFFCCLFVCIWFYFCLFVWGACFILFGFCF